jgi:hypothetical protein
MAAIMTTSEKKAANKAAEKKAAKKAAKKNAPETAVAAAEGIANAPEATCAAQTTAHVAPAPPVPPPPVARVPPAVVEIPMGAALVDPDHNIHANILQLFREFVQAWQRPKPYKKMVDGVMVAKTHRPQFNLVSQV